MSDNENEDSPMPFASATQQQTPTAQPVVQPGIQTVTNFQGPSLKKFSYIDLHNE